MPDRQIHRLLAATVALDAEGVRRTAALLDDLRRAVVADLASASSEYERGSIAGVLRAVDQAVLDFRRRYSAELASLQARGFQIGTLLVDAPLLARHLVLPTTISGDLLHAAQQYAADLVTGLTDAARAALTSEIRVGVLASRPPFELIRRIGSGLDQGRFASIAQRAETITRTETNRIVSLATYRRFKEAQRVVPQLRQEWRATMDDRTRQSHRVAHGQIRDIGQAFEVGGESLLFPGDPNGSAGETINCRCRAVPYAASWTDVIDPFANTPAPAWMRERLAAAEVSA